MWCFFDESYPPEGGVTAVAACLMQTRTVAKLEREMFVARREHLGDKNAKDALVELKGSSLLSKGSFKYAKQYGISTNHNVVEDILNGCYRFRVEHPIYIFGAVVYGAHDILKATTDRKLAKPLKDILNAVSAVAYNLNPKDKVNLVYDEQIGARADVAAHTKQFVAGVGLKNVSIYPLSAVSVASPGVQLCDIAAYILGRQATGDPKFGVWMSRLRRLEWRSSYAENAKRGIQIYDADAFGVVSRRRHWLALPAQKKELGHAGKASFGTGKAPLQFSNNGIGADEAKQ